MFKPQAGAYRQILIDNLQDKMLAMAFQTQQIKLAVTSSFVGSVQTRPELTDKVKECFRALPDNENAQYYLTEMEAGRILIVNAIIPSASDNRYFATGELYFRS